MADETPEPITWDGLVEDLAASETDIRAMQHSVSHIDTRFKKAGRTDLMPGRSGRALWAWQMVNTGIDPFGLGFLHTFYYQALDAGRR
jgi:hypothetical protein